MTVHATYDHLLVALSILIACAAAYTALDLAGRIRATGGAVRCGWLAASAVAMGGGIWSMHFVAMLAMHIPGFDVVFNPGLTALSILFAIVATGTGFLVVSLHGVGPVPLTQSAIFMGMGIVAMHYTGMAAIHAPISMRFDPIWVAVSIAIAIGASAAALWLAFAEHDGRLRLGAALVMGVAIAGMHFTGMAGLLIEGPAAGEQVHAAVLDRGALALAVGGTTFVILFFVLLASLFDRRFAELAEREADALRRSEEVLRALYRRTPLPLHALDAEGRIEKVSDAWLDLLGYSREEIIGQVFRDLIAEDTPDPGSVDMPRLLEEGEFRDLPCRIVTRTGTVLDVLVSARLERDGEGRVQRALCGLVDVTAHRRAEEALRQAQKMEALGQLTGGVAHDFNNLLAVIVGNLDRLQRHLAQDATALPLAETAAAAAARGVALTQRMLAFARQQRLTPEFVDLAALVTGMDDLLRQSLGPETRVRIEVADELPPVEADPIQLELALINLAVNSRDAMPAGGTVTISARKDPSRVPDELAPGEYVCIAVSDEGEGMDEATLARARDPFFTTKSLGKGTGLGLSMVDGFVEQSGGALRLSSRRGEGSTAEIWLPVSEAAAAEAPVPAREATPPAPAKPAAPPRALTVLAVDDDMLVLMNTTLLLEELGHRVVEASSGPDALAKLAEDDAIDVVVTDQGMPEMTGLQLAAEIRARWPGLPLVIATGYAELPTDEPCIRIGKPFDARTLAAAIERALQEAPGTEKPRRALAN